MKNYYLYETELGKIKIVEDGSAITSLCFEASKVSENAIECESFLIKEAKKQLDEYLSGTRLIFDLPLRPHGTVFQQNVWKALCTIPYGETRSYKQIAEEINCPKGYRAVGLANNKNPIAIIIPCHRVIGSNQKLVGYAGGLAIKSNLLALEGAIKKDNE